MRDFIKKNSKELIVLGLLIILTVLLCIPATLKIFVGVFGYLAYLYLIIGYALLILEWKRIKIKQKKSRLLQYILTYIFLVATLHTAFCGRSMAEDGFGSYVTGAYDNMTVGGVIFSLITCPIVLPCKYVASIIIFFLATVAFGFFIIKPYIFVGKKPEITVTKDSSHEKELYTEKLTQSDNNKAVPDKKTDLGTPVVLKSNNESPIRKPLTKKEEAERLLLGIDEHDNPFEEISDISDETYNTGRYKFKKPISMEAKSLITKSPAPIYTEPTPQPEKPIEKVYTSSDLLSSPYNPYEPISQQENTIGKEIESSLKVNTYIPSETIFQSPERKPDFVEAPKEEELPVMPQTEFSEAIRQGSGYAAPQPIKVEQPMAETKTTVITTSSEKSDTLQSVKEETKQTAATETEKEEIPFLPEHRAIVPYNRPPLSLFVYHETKGFSPYVENYEELKEVFEVKLKYYNIDATLIKAIKGPTITLCVLDLSEKCSISKVFTAKKDIQRLLRTSSEINIIPQIGTESYFGIEIPNKIGATVSFKEIICSEEYVNAKGSILIALGKTADGSILIEDLGTFPHALIAGTTGSGKSVCINTILASILYRYSPEEVKLVLIDLKFVEMELYGGLPHMLFRKPLNEVEEIDHALSWLREETKRRFTVFKQNHVRNIEEFNELKAPEDKVPRIVIIIDEASELMTDPKSGKSMETSLCSLARLARAAGVHLIFATQNPVKEVITNEIQNNLNTKIAFQVNDYNHSMVIFKSKGAETLLGRGDMLIKKASKMVRAQCSFIDTQEIEPIVQYIKEHNSCQFNYIMIDRILHGETEKEEEEELLKTPTPTINALPFVKKDLDNDENFQFLLREGLRICLESNKVSASMLQREMSKGFNSIAKLVDYMEKHGYISAPYSGNKRDLLISKSQFNEMYPDAPMED